MTFNQQHSVIQKTDYILTVYVTLDVYSCRIFPVAFSKVAEMFNALLISILNKHLLGIEFGLCK